MGSRNANSPRLSETVCIFLTLEGGASGIGSGITTTSAFGKAKPDSRKTVPSRRTYGSAAAFFLAAIPGRTTAVARSSRLIILFFLFFLFLFILVLDVFGIFVVVFFLLVLILAGFKFQRIQASHADGGSALIAGQRVSFVQIFLVKFDHRFAVWASGHLDSSKAQFSYTRIRADRLRFRF